MQQRHPNPKVATFYAAIWLTFALPLTWASFADERLDDGRQRIVRHGLGPERQIQTGIGALNVQRPKVRDWMPTPGIVINRFQVASSSAGPAVARILEGEVD